MTQDKVTVKQFMEGARGKRIRGGMVTSCVIEGCSPLVCGRWVQVGDRSPEFICDTHFKQVKRIATKAVEKEDE
jgi:hypothetical protein